LARLDVKSKRLPNQLESAARSGCVWQERIDSRFVLACRERRRVEDKTVPIVLCAFRTVHVRAKFYGGFVGDEFIVDKELDFDACPWPLPIDCPAVYRFGVGQIKHPAQVRIAGSKIETDCNAGDQQGLGN